MPLLTAARDLFRSLARRNVPQRRRRPRLSLEPLEGRSVPAVFTVNSLADVAPGPADPTASVVTLRQAVELANQNHGADQIRFARGLSGTITLTNGPLEVSDAVAICGPGSQQLAVSGNNKSQVLLIDSGATVCVSGLTVRDGQAVRYGGGIFNDGTLTLTGCAVVDNTASNDDPHNTSFGGGGIENRGSLTLWGCQVANNTLVGTQTFFQEIDDGGGGIDNNSGDLTIYYSTLSGNQSFNAGALRTSDGTLTMVGSVVTGNTATGIVGGAMALATSVDRITGCVIADNHITSVFGSGGAFSNDSSDTVLEGCLVSGNSSALFAGAIDVASVEEPGAPASSVVADGCVFTGNQCVSTGGGFFGLPGGDGGAFAVIDGTSLSLDGCLVAGNQAGTDGGGIWVGNVLGTFGNCHVTVTGSSLVDNSAARNGGGIFVQVADSLVLDQTLVSSNQAGGHGGGLYLATSPADLDFATAAIVHNSPDDVFTAG